MTVATGSLLPHVLLAENYCWPRNYGHKAGVSTPEGLIQIAELFLRYGFIDLNARSTESGRSPIAEAAARGDHPGMLEYATFLVERGADLCASDPDDTNPLALARRGLENATSEETTARFREFVALFGASGPAT